MRASPSGSVAPANRPALASTVKVVSSMTVFELSGSTGGKFEGILSSIVPVAVAVPKVASVSVAPKAKFIVSASLTS